MKERDLLKLWIYEWKTFLCLFYKFSNLKNFTSVGSLHGMLWGERKWLQLEGHARWGGDRCGRFTGVINGALPSQTTLSRVSNPLQERGCIQTVFRQQTAGMGGNTVSNQCHNSTSNPVSKTHWLFRQHSGNDPATNHILYRNALSVHQNRSRFMPHSH